MDAVDRDIINRLQDGLPISERPYAEVAAQLGIGEDELLQRLQGLLQNRKLTRFGPLYDAEKLGGAFSLVAMQVPDDRFEEVAGMVNSYAEVAHNYQRDHKFNMWFVLATETPEGIAAAADAIEAATGLTVLRFPKLREFFIGFRVAA